jgi:hypothetical protein
LAAVGHATAATILRVRSGAQTQTAGSIDPATGFQKRRDGIISTKAVNKGPDFAAELASSGQSPVSQSKRLNLADQTTEPKSDNGDTQI